MRLYILGSIAVVLLAAAAQANDCWCVKPSPVIAPVLVYREEPEFHGIQLAPEDIGKEIFVLIYIDNTGVAKNAVIQSTPSPEYREPALAAARKCKFEPAKNAEGEPVGVWYAIEYEIKDPEDSGGASPSAGEKNDN